MAAKIRLLLAGINSIYHHLTHAIFMAEPGVPNGVVRWRSEDAHGYALYRVDELNAPRVQVNGRVVVGAAGSVLDVAFDGSTQACQRRPNLVVASRLGFDLHK
jgi:hypothetical protein